MWLAGGVAAASSQRLTSGLSAGILSAETPTDSIAGPVAAARRFDSPACRSKLASELASDWQNITAIGTPKGNPADRTGQEVYLVTFNQSLSAMYVRNQKAASTFLINQMPQLFPTSVGYYQVTRAWASVATDEFPPSEFVPNAVFTVVSDPIKVALDAYLEVLERNVGNQTANLGHNITKDDLPYLTYSGSDPYERLRLYLDAVEARQALGGNGFHSYPQALKIDVLRHAAPAARRFDAILKLEDGLGSDDGLPFIGRRLGVPAAYQAPTRNESHNHGRADGGWAVDADSLPGAAPDLMRRLCRVYAVDFVCLGYELPSVCVA